jgi:hypothetical protein
MQFIPTVGGSAVLPMDQIHEDVKLAVEEAIKAMAVAEGRLRIDFSVKENKIEPDMDGEANVKLFMQQAAAYVAQRPLGKEGVLVFRKSPTRQLPPHVIDFRINTDLAATAAANAVNGTKTDPGANPGRK